MAQMKFHVCNGNGMEKEMDNKTIAIISMWISIGICSFSVGVATILLVLFGAVVTDNVYKAKE